MKILFVSLALICMFFVQELLAQTRTEQTKSTTDSTGKTILEKIVTVGSTIDITPRNNMLIVNPLKFILFYNLSYFRRINAVTVVGGGFQIPTIKEFGGWGINTEVRLHPSARAPNGFYVAPNVSFFSFSAEDRKYEVDPQGNYIYTTIPVTRSTFSIGGLLGWQWFPADEFAIGLGIGMDYYLSSSNNNTYYNPNLFSKVDGIIPAFRFDIGYVW